MTPPRYRAILFDLCGTLMPYDTGQIPVVSIRGQAIRTTTFILYEIFKADHPALSYETFYDQFIAATEGVNARRESENREILSEVRFDTFLNLLGVNPSQNTTLRDRLKATHLQLISRCLTFPPAHRELIHRLKKNYPIGLVTNFDDTDTVYHVLEREGIRDLFCTIVISAEIGFRKPHPRIFEVACERLSVSPTEVLFIGDSWTSDICGAKPLGMDAAWINPEGLPLPEEGPRPDYVLSDLAEPHDWWNADKR